MSFCKHRFGDMCKKDAHPCAYSKACFEPEEPKPKTNADHIRSMTDEELAKFIPNWSYTDACKCGEHYVDCNNECEKCVAEWLRQPYKEDNT